ncbi:MAG: M28 family peptidase [Actinomycetota bacterium]
MAHNGTGFIALLASLALIARTQTADPIASEPSPRAEPSLLAHSTPLLASSEESLAVERFSKQRAMRHVRKLAGDIGIRVKATNNERRGARYIAEKFRSFGYRTNVQKFSVGGGTSRNVVAWWPGAKRYPFVVGGHMDTVPGSPGANDNASGTAVILELARILAGTPQANLIRFVAFGSEEYGEGGSHHDGSRHYVERLGDEGRRRLAGMISVDMIADGRPLLIGHSNIAGKPIVARTVYNKMKEAGFNVDLITLCDCSDHGPFEHAGIPASFAYSGKEPDYHSPSDTASNLVPDDLLRTGRAVRAFLLKLDMDMIRRFRRA